MSCPLRKDEPATRGLRRVFKKKTARALKILNRSSPSTDEGVHTARKRLKEARAVLRLLRKELGDRAFRRANIALRDAARPFAEMRDASALVDTFDDLAGRLARRAGARAMITVRTVLVSERERIRCATLEGGAVQESARSVESARDRLLGQSLGKRGWGALGAGVRDVHRAGRKSLGAARESPSVERLHEWRKQAKYLRHVLEILLCTGSDRVRKLERQAHRLTDLLGKDHDLAVLREKLKSHCIGGVSRGGIRVMERLVKSRRTKLQKRAFAMAKGIYGDTPKAFERRLHEDWRAWLGGERDSPDIGPTPIVQERRKRY